MRTPSVTLLVMPWYPLALPSIQAGTLAAVLRQAGIATQTRWLTLDFMDHCVAERFTVADYKAVSERQPGLGLREWIFAVPPFRDAPAEDEAYLAYLRQRKVDEAEIANACRMRALVPGFLERCPVAVVGHGSAYRAVGVRGRVDAKGDPRRCHAVVTAAGRAPRPSAGARANRCRAIPSGPAGRMRRKAGRWADS